MLKLLNNVIPFLRGNDRRKELDHQQKKVTDREQELELKCAELAAELEVYRQERDGYKKAYEIVCTNLASTEEILRQLKPDAVDIAREALLPEPPIVSRSKDSDGLVDALKAISLNEDLPQHTKTILLDPLFSIEDRSLYRSLFADRRLEKWRGIAEAIACIVNTQYIKYRPRSADQTKAQEIVETLEREGLVRLDSMLSPQQISDVQQYFLDRPVLNGHIPGTARHRNLGRYVEHTAETYPIGSYSTCDIVNAPHLLELVLQPLILDAAARYFKCAPRLAWLQSWWNFASDDGPSYSYGQNRFHRDETDAKMFWLYIYLSDVKPGCGEHRIIRGSGNFDELQSAYARACSDPHTAELLRDYKLEDFFGPGHSIPEDVKLALFPGKEEVLSGPAGTMFISRGIDYHKVTLPSNQRRQIFAARFCLNDFCDIEFHRDGDRIPGRIIARRVGYDEQLRYITSGRFDWSAT